MKHRNLLLLATVLASSVGLASLGVSHAQTADTAVDAPVAVTTTDRSTSASAMKPARMQMHAERLADQAKKFGMTTTELQTAIDSGKPMYQIAAEHGVTHATEKSERLVELKTRLDDMVKVKYMTQGEADSAYNEAKDSSMIGGPGFGGPHGRR